MKQINLIPPEYSHSKYVRRRVTIWAEMVLAVVAMVGALSLNLRGRLQAAENERAGLAMKAEVNRKLAQDLKTIAARKQQAVEKLSALYGIQRKRVCGAILHHIADACGDRVFLVEMTIGRTPKAKNIPAALQRRRADRSTGGDRTIQMKGYALTNIDLTQFVSRLSRSSLLSEVNLKFWRQSDVEAFKLINFEIECLPHAIEKKEASDESQ